MTNRPHWVLSIRTHPLRKLKMQALLPQPPEAGKAYLDSNVPEATQEGIVLYRPDLKCAAYSVLVCSIFAI